MTRDAVRVVAKVTARPEKADELESVLAALVGPTRAEPGCVSYELGQSQTDACEFVFVEEWASGSAIDAHMKTPHVQEAFSKAQSLLAKPPEISRYSILR